MAEKRQPPWIQNEILPAARRLQLVGDGRENRTPGYNNAAVKN